LRLQDLLRFNRFFIDKEEDSVIKLQALSDRIKAASSVEQLQALKAELVDFHGGWRSDAPCCVFSAGCCEHNIRLTALPAASSSCRRSPHR
jgi:hypothetical protein